jgi:hypothetical protein
MMDRSALAVQIVAGKLQQLNSKISMTFDSWTSLTGEPFLSITAHYISSPIDKPQQWELKADQLAFMPIQGNHSGSNTAQHLIQTIKKYGIRERVGWFTADNATNNDTALEAVASFIDPSGDWDPVEHRVR